jgi:hypothetical protein
MSTGTYPLPTAPNAVTVCPGLSELCRLPRRVQR